jgi:hypothetical protein
VARGVDASIAGLTTRTRPAYEGRKHHELDAPRCRELLAKRDVGHAAPSPSHVVNSGGVPPGYRTPGREKVWTKANGRGELNGDDTHIAVGTQIPHAIATVRSICG